MKKSTINAMVCGVMWGFICVYLNFFVSDYMFWVIILLGNILTTVLYDICKD